MVTSFKHLERVISVADNNFSGGSQKPGKGTGGVAKVDEDYQQGGGGASGVRFFFKALVQLVLLSGVEKWVFTPRIGRVLGGLQY